MDDENFLFQLVINDLTRKEILGVVCLKLIPLFDIFANVTASITS